MATRALLPEPAPLAETRESLLAVPGIHCAGCISKIENGLPKVNGIESARVNMGARRVAIRHDAALSPPDLKAALARLGFEAEALADELPSVCNVHLDATGPLEVRVTDTRGE